MAEGTELLERLESRVLVLTMNRPDQLNALTPEMIATLRAALERAAVDGEVGAVVLTGSGRGFCAGGDVKAMAKSVNPALPLEARVRQLRTGMETSRLLHTMGKPTIAMVRGPAAGAGLSLALACDLVFASDTAKLTSAFAKVALSGDFGGSYFLTRRLGARARQFVMLSPVVDAAEASRLGLVDRVIADADLERETMETARALANGPGVALGYMKANLNLAERGATFEDMLDIEAEHHTRCYYTEDHADAARAFVEKRAPVFKGR
jgi:2-(1,2-epoxy-1,2-dihydrophenyl)acetyl-CoA isomerase